MTEEEERARAEHAEQFRVRDPWEDLIESDPGKYSGFTTDKIMDQLEIPLHQRGKHHQMRLQAVLKKCGFVKVRTQLMDGSRPRVWRRP